MQPIVRYAVLAITAVILAGCAERSSTMVIQSNQAVAAQAGIAGTHVVTKTAIAGQTMNFGGTWSLNPDCTLRSIPTMRITQQPSHGTAQVVQREDFPNYPAANPRSACNKTRAMGMFIEYTSTPGYTGSDFFVIEIIAENGAQGEYKTVVTVK